MNDQMVRERVVQAERALAALEALPDPQSRDVGILAVQALLELYGEGLARMVGHAARLGGAAIADAFAGDELVSHLLLLHGLEPPDDNFIPLATVQVGDGS
jgi:hypothetical protein